MSKHTQGPWEWCGSDLDGGKHQEFSVLEVKVSCAAYCYGGMANIAVSVEDARLIAAAPELLEALLRLRAAFVVVAGANSPFAKAALEMPDAAIAKARGEK